MTDICIDKCNKNVLNEQDMQSCVDFCKLEQKCKIFCEGSLVEWICEEDCKQQEKVDVGEQP